MIVARSRASTVSARVQWEVSMTRFLALTATFIVAAWTQTAFGEETRGVTSNEIVFG